jgi:uncharacterized protein DUF1837
MDASSIDDALQTALLALAEAPNVSTHLAKAHTGQGSPEIGLLFARFREDEPDLEALAEFLAQQVVNYVVPLKKRREVLKSAVSAKGGADFSNINKLNMEARKKFIEFNEEDPGRASEIGELLAYLVAIQWLGAFQVASKMALKTSFNMPVHGLDGIHAVFQNGVMTLYFLESKLADSAGAGLRDFCTSVKQFGDKRKQYLLEYSIIADLSNLDALEPADRDLALSYLDVYGSNKSKRIERSVGVVCYSENTFNLKLPKSGSTTPQMHEDAFAVQYSQLLQKFRNQFTKALSKNGLSHAECQAWLVAVPNKNELRQLFNAAIQT